MGAALSAPEGACPLHEDGLVSQLSELLSQQPQCKLLLSDLDALLTEELRQLAQEHGGVACWLRRFPARFEVSGCVGEESISLTPGLLYPIEVTAADPAAPEGALTPPQTARNTDIITPLKSAPGGQAQPVVYADDDMVCPGADSAAGRPSSGGGLPFDELVDGQCALQMRGLPYRATVEDIRAFLGDFATELVEESPIHLVLNRDGRPSGFARVQFVSPEAARQCRDGTHLRSMQDRYVEVFLYTDRPRARHRRGSEDGDPSPVKESNVLDSAVTREQVMRECREVMADPKHGQRMLLSMLGVELSSGARACVKQIDNGLKHFLAQHPDEFSVDGSKGCEHVTYTPVGWQPGKDACRRELPKEGAVPLQLSEVLALPPLPAPPPVAEPPREAAPPGSPRAPGSPKPSDCLLVHPTPKSALVPPTPSSLGYPHETPSRYPSPAYPQLGQDQAPLPWQLQGTVPPWPGAPPAPADAAAAAAAAGMAASMPSFAAADSTAAMAAAMASAMAAMGAAPPWVVPPAWPMPTPPFLPGFMPTAQAPWGATLAAAAATGQPCAPTQASAPKADVRSDNHQGCKIWPGQSSSDSEATLGSAVRLRGLPFSSTEQDVLAFFAQHDIVDRIVEGPNAVTLLLRTNGRPSGQAVVQMQDRGDAAIAQHVLDGKWMGSRYIEVFLHGEDNSDGGAAGGGAAGCGAGAGAAGQQPVGDDAMAQTTMAAALGAASAPAGAIGMMEAQPVQIAGQAMCLPDFGAQFKGMPTWPAVPWGPMPAMGGAPLPGGATEPTVDSAWSTLFESLGGSQDTLHVCPQLQLGVPLPVAGALAGAAAV